MNSLISRTWWDQDLSVRENSLSHQWCPNHSRMTVRVFPGRGVSWKIFRLESGECKVLTRQVRISWNSRLFGVVVERSYLARGQVGVCTSSPSTSWAANNCFKTSCKQLEGLVSWGFEDGLTECSKFTLNSRGPDSPKVPQVLIEKVPGLGFEESKKHIYLGLVELSEPACDQDGSPCVKTPTSGVEPKQFRMVTRWRSPRYPYPKRQDPRSPQSRRLVPQSCPGFESITI